MPGQVRIVVEALLRHVGFGRRRQAVVQRLKDRRLVDAEIERLALSNPAAARTFAGVSAGTGMARPAISCEAASTLVGSSIAGAAARAATAERAGSVLTTSALAHASTARRAKQRISRRFCGRGRGLHQ